MLCALVLCLCVCLCKGVRFPGPDVSDSCELPQGYWELNPGPLQGQQGLWRDAPSHLSSPHEYLLLSQ